MSAWYIVQKGLRSKPMSVSEIVALVKSNKLGPMDRATISTVEGAWMPLHRCQPFESCFNPEDLEKLDQLWVVLKKKRAGRGFVQKKPLTEEGVKEAIQTGEVSYSDFIWRAGMCEWYRIAFLSEFCKADVTGAVEFPEIPTAQFPKTEDVSTVSKEVLAESVVEQPKKAEAQNEKEVIPPETDGQNLATNFNDTPEEKQNKERLSRRGSERRQDDRRARLQPDRRQQEDRRSFFRRFFGRERRKSKPGNIWNLLRAFFRSLPRPKLLPMAIVFFVGATVGTFLTISTLDDFRKSTTTSDMTRRLKRIIKPQPEPLKRPVVEEKQSPPPVKKVEVKQKPTYLKIKFRNLKSDQAELRFVTDASSHYPIEIVVFGKAGEILKSWALYFTKKVRFQPFTKKKTIKLYGLGLAEGRYQVTAKVGRFETGRTFFLGKPGSGFRKKMRGHKKKMSFWFQEERKSLIKQTDRWLKWIESQGKRPIGKGPLRRKWISQWRQRESTQVRAAKSIKMRNFVLPEHWLGLGEISDDLLAVLKKAPVNVGSPQYRQILRVQRKLKKERRKFLSLSLFK